MRNWINRFMRNINSILSEPLIIVRRRIRAVPKEYIVINTENYESKK